jgi:hypothetical protein
LHLLATASSAALQSFLFPQITAPQPASRAQRKMSANDSFPQKGLVVPAEGEKDDNMLGMVFYSFSIDLLLQLPRSTNS